MKPASVFVEGAVDAALLGRVLKGRTKRPHEFKEAGGKSSLISFAKSWMTSRAIPVAVVMDADTTDDASVREQEIVYYDLLRMAAGGIPFRLFLLKPDLKGYVASLIGRPTGSHLRDAAKRPWWVDELSAADLKRIAEDEVMQSLIQFLDRPTPWRLKDSSEVERAT